MTAQSDKPTVYSLSSLTKEIKPVEPFVLDLGQRKGRVTFPDIWAMEYERAEQIVVAYQSGQASLSQTLEGWLKPADLARLREQKLDLRTMRAVLEKVMEHFQGSYGEPGEADASES